MTILVPSIMSPDQGEQTHDDERSERDVLLESISELLELLVAAESLDVTVRRVAELACRAIPGCAQGSVTRVGDRGAYTVVATASDAQEIDEVQYASGSGPCLDAIREQRPVRVRTMAGSGDYERFRAAALERGIHSSLSLPLDLRSRPVGALNLYAEEDDAFGKDADEISAYLAAQVALAISCAELHDNTRGLVGQLEGALSSRDVIGQAKGIIMATEHVDADAAFTMLRRASHNSNRKLRDIADRVVAAGGLPEPG
jgi:transcriptional regulator with GAF, ATPase, and Fis domain